MGLFDCLKPFWTKKTPQSHGNQTPVVTQQVKEQIIVEIGESVTDTGPCKTAIQIAKTLANEEEFVNKKLWQILQILQKDNQYKNSLWHLTEEDVDAMRTELLENPDKLRRFLKIVKDQNIILKDPSSETTVSRGVLDKVPDHLQKVQKVDKLNEVGKVLDEVKAIYIQELNLTNKSWEIVNLFIDPSKTFLNLKSTAKYDHSRFIKTINHYYNSEEIEWILFSQITNINNNKLDVNTFLQDLVQTKQGIYVFQEMLENSLIDKNDAIIDVTRKDILPLIPTLNETEEGKELLEFLKGIRDSSGRVLLKPSDTQTNKEE